MADLTLRRIEIRNWMTVRSSILEFPEKGLILVRGRNLCTDGKMESIGSGKTALGEAISRTLLGVAGRYTLFGHYSTNEKGDTLVKVECDHKGEPLTVQAGFKSEINPEAEGLCYTHGSQEIQRSRMHETRADLAKLLTVPADLAAWTVYMDGDRLRFDDIRQKASVDLLMTALNQPPWTEYARKTALAFSSIKKDKTADLAALNEAKTRLTDCQAEHDAAKQALARAKSAYKEKVAAHTNRLQAVKHRVAGLNQQLGVIEKQMKHLHKQIEEAIAANAQELKDLEIARNDRQDALFNLQEARVDLVTKLGEARSTATTENDTLQEMLNMPKDCPTCGKPWDQVHSEQAIQAQAKKVAVIQVAVTRAQTALQAHDRKTQEARQALSQAKEIFEARNAESPVAAMSGQYEELEEEENRVNKSLQEAELELERAKRPPDQEEVNSATTLLTERQRQLAKASEAVKAASVKLVQTREAAKVIEYWNTAFGPTGIPNMILNEALGPLNATARRISAMMTGGTIEVGYTTSRELLKGGSKAELIVTVKNLYGSHRADGSSKGEGSLTNLIIAETLAEVGGVSHRIGYRWYDEIAVNQDEVVCCSIFSYLRELAHRQGILVFLVSHSAQAANYADAILVAQKDKSGTTYHWD